jgi:peptidoglycan/LPS O-acetylase OafA/YrhL
MKLFETSQASDGDIIDCLHGIRALSIMWIVHGHRVQTYFTFPIINKVQFREVGERDAQAHSTSSTEKLFFFFFSIPQQWLNSWSSVISTSTPMAIDTFFLLSGLLATKSILRKLDST